MNLISTRFVAEFAEVLTTVLIHFVWQGVVLSLILLVVVKLLNVRSAQRRYLLSVGTLLMMGIAPFVTAMLHHQGNSQRERSPFEVSVPSNVIVEKHSAMNTGGGIDSDLQTESAKLWNPGIEVYVLIAWLGGVLILSTRLAIGFGVTLWIRARVKPLSEEFEQRVRILGDKLRVDGRQRVFTCVRVGQAVAVGIIRPVVLLPVAWFTQLTPEMLEAVIAHELAHIRRWDLWANLVQRVIETLFFYHPAVWWLSRRIHLEREMCCDEIAAGCFNRATYAQSLESVARIAHGNLLVAASINGGSKMNLLSRIQYVLGAEPTDATANWWSIGFVAVILPFATVVAYSITVATTPSVAIADEPLDESNAAEKIELLGGEVVRDSSLSGNPVIGVLIARDHRFSYKNLPLLKAFKQLTSISFWNVEITDESLKDLSDFKNLEVLEIGCTNRPSKFIGQIQTRISDAGLKELRGLKHLKRLDLMTAKITDEGLKELSSLTELTDLDLRATKISDVGLKELKVLSHLTSLNVGSNQTTGITDNGLKELSQLRRLTDLDLSATRITDAGLKELRQLTNLKSLNLGFNRITGAGMREWSELKNLTDLNLVHCLVSDVGLKEIGKIKSLKSLRLGFCPVTDMGLKELTQLTNLTELVLWETEVTNVGIQDLKDSLPNVKISQ